MLPSRQRTDKLPEVLRVLIVEDEMLLAMDIEALIEDRGHDVLDIAAGVDEVEALNPASRPHLALVDVQLANGSSGLDACRRITERWPDCLVIFLTANVAKIPADFCGGHGVIAKPFSQAGIVSALDYLAEVIFAESTPARLAPASLTPSARLSDRLAPG